MPGQTHRPMPGKGKPPHRFLDGKLFPHPTDRHGTHAASDPEAHRNLETIGCGVNDKTLACTIIMALPDSLSTLQTILFGKDDMTVTSESVIGQILANKEHRVHYQAAPLRRIMRRLANRIQRQKPRQRQRQRPTVNGRDARPRNATKRKRSKKRSQPRPTHPRPLALEDYQEQLPRKRK